MFKIRTTTVISNSQVWTLNYSNVKLLSNNSTNKYAGFKSTLVSCTVFGLCDTVCELSRQVTTGVGTRRQWNTCCLWLNKKSLVSKDPGWSCFIKQGPYAPQSPPLACTECVPSLFPLYLLHLLCCCISSLCLYSVSLEQTAYFEYPSPSFSLLSIWPSFLLYLPSPPPST